jgi:hypothetical protein
MSENTKSDQFDAAQFDRWLMQVADATITDEDMESLLRMWLEPDASRDVREDQSLLRRLQAALNSYCHIIRITREYKDEDVDLETSLGLVAKCKRGEPLTDEDIRLIGKRSSNNDADRNLRHAFWSVVKVIEGLPVRQSAPFEVVPIEFYTPLSDERFRVLVDSLLEQAVVQGTGSVTDKAWFAESAPECPNLERKLFIAYGISLLTEPHDRALRCSKMSPEEKADHALSEKQLRDSGVFGDLPSEEGDA